MKSLVQVVTATWIFLIKIFTPGFEGFVGCITKMYCFDRLKYKFHTRFRNPNVQVSIGSCGISIHGFNVWPWPIEPVVMAYCANRYPFDWICCLLGKIFTNISTSQNWGKNPGSLGDELAWRMDGQTFSQGIIEIWRMLTSVFLSDQMWPNFPWNGVCYSVCSLQQPAWTRTHECTNLDG